MQPNVEKMLRTGDLKVIWFYDNIVKKRRRIPMIFSEKLLVLRKSKGLTQEEPGLSESK